MAADLIKIVDNLRDDLKGLYLKHPEAIWDKPIVAFSKKSGGVNYLEGIKDNQHVMDWLRTNLNNDIESIVVARMVVKQSSVLDANGQPIVKEKAIMVMGKQVVTGRTYVSITPCLEHRDYRSDQFAEEQNKKFDPTLKGADATKKVVDEVTGQQHYLQSKFGKEQVLDSKKGNQFMVDPIIEGVYPAPRGLDKAEDLNAPSPDASRKLA